MMSAATPSAMPSIETPEMNEIEAIAPPGAAGTGIAPTDLQFIGPLHGVAMLQEHVVCRATPIISCMHLLIPFASSPSDSALQVLQNNLELPNLSALLARLRPTSQSITAADADAYTLTPPHERALAAFNGWQGADGCLPFAAQAARLDGIDVADLAWGLVTPCHWHVARDHVSLVQPSALALSETESRAAFAAVQPLFEDMDYRLLWGAPMRWYVAHESLADLPCASIDRVIGRNVELWLRGGVTGAAALREMRRLQSEWQLLLYPHPLNEEREQRGALTLNSFWLSGCGHAQPTSSQQPAVDNTLRAPCLANDWPAWAEAWRSLDETALALLLNVAREGQPVSLTLCGETPREAVRGCTPFNLANTLSVVVKAPSGRVAACTLKP